MLESGTHLENLVDMRKPPAELVVAARAALAEAGYTRAAADSTYGFDWDGGFHLRLVPRDAAGRACQTEVGDLGAAAAIDHHVGGLEIAVQHALVVRSGEARSSPSTYSMEMN